MGTWAIPETIGDLVTVNQNIRNLNLVLEECYSVTGDDELFDQIESSIDRMAEIRDWGLERHDLELIHQAIECPMCRFLGKTGKDIFSTDRKNDLYFHLIEEHKMDKKEANCVMVQELKR